MNAAAEQLAGQRGHVERRLPSYRRHQGTWAAAVRMRTPAQSQAQAQRAHSNVKPVLAPWKEQPELTGASMEDDDPANPSHFQHVNRERYRYGRRLMTSTQIVRDTVEKRKFFCSVDEGVERQAPHARKNLLNTNKHMQHDIVIMMKLGKITLSNRLS